MGCVYDELMNYSEALKHFRISLTASQRIYPDDHPDIQRIYMFTDMIHYKLCEYELALENFIKLQFKEENYLSDAWIYNYTGESYDKIQQYEKAIVFYSKSLNFVELFLKNNVSSFVETELERLNNCIGLCYDKNNQSNSEDDYTKSLEHYNRSLKYYTQWNHFENLIVVHKNIVMLYLKRNDYQLAIENIEKVLNIQENVLIQKDENKLLNLYNLLFKLYINFGLHCCNQIQDYTLSIEQFQKALQIRQNITSEITNSIITADLFHFIDVCHFENNQLTLAFEYYNKSLELIIEENNEEKIIALRNKLDNCNKKIQNIF